MQSKKNSPITEKEIFAKCKTVAKRLHSTDPKKWPYYETLAEQILDHLGEVVYKIDSKDMLYLSEKAVKLFDKYAPDNVDSLISAMEVLAASYRDLAFTDKAEEALKRRIELVSTKLEGFKKARQLAFCYEMYAGIDTDNRDSWREKSLEASLEASKEKYRGKSYTQNLQDIGRLYGSGFKHDMKKAVEYLEKALDLAQKRHQKTLIASIAADLGKIQLSQGNIDEAEKCQELALEYVDYESDHFVSTAEICSFIGILFIPRGQYEDAWMWLNAARTRFKMANTNGGYGSDVEEIDHYMKQIKEEHKILPKQ